ncbi:mitochondrial inner membrane protease subunit 2-like isoform X1 [Montipora foliosa]|uniref:mitochondrial inner membrane protease subunit 2-like isoform X1 n=1 Tax=Montipora foliosa TaxID=591990 RepID=UPI0035F1ED60
MVFQTLRPYLGRFALGFALGFPIAVTIVENIANLKGVHGISMQPTLNPKPHFNSDVVLVNCWAVRGFEGINRGDVVTLVDPSDPDAVLIKRVLGVEGDYVKNFLVFYCRSLNYKKKIVYIPKGHCWVEGDNHSHSHDSNSFGPVSLGLIQGKATHVVWPPERWQRLENVIPEDRLVYGDDSFLESRSVKDAPVFFEAGTKRDGLSYHNQGKSYTYADESSSVSELISGPIS